MRLHRSLLMPAAVIALAGFSSPAAHASSHMIIPGPDRPVSDCLRPIVPNQPAGRDEPAIRCDIAIDLYNIPARAAQPTARLRDPERVAARGVDRYRTARRRDPERVAARGVDRFHAPR
jgi:hypothetical protein